MFPNSLDMAEAPSLCFSGGSSWAGRMVWCPSHAPCKLDQDPYTATPQKPKCLFLTLVVQEAEAELVRLKDGNGEAKSSPSCPRTC